VEMIWNHTKYGRLANFLPEDIAHLAREGTTALQALLLFLCWLDTMMRFFRFTKLNR